MLYNPEDLQYNYKRVNGVTRIEVTTPDERRRAQENRITIDRNQVIAVTVMATIIAGAYIYNTLVHGWTPWL